MANVNYISLSHSLSSLFSVNNNVKLTAKPISSQQVQDALKAKPIVLEKSTSLSLLTVFLSLLSLATCGYLLLSRNSSGGPLVPWILIPFVWIIAGITLSTIQCIVRDAALNIATPYHIINQIIGLLLSAPLLVPFSTIADDLKVDNNDNDNKISPIPSYKKEKTIINTLLSSFTIHNASSLIVNIYVLGLLTLAYINLGLYGVMLLLGSLLVYMNIRSLVHGYMSNFAFIILPSNYSNIIPSYRFFTFTKALMRLNPDINPHFHEKMKDLISRIHIIHCVILFGVPIICIYGAINVPLTLPVFIWSFIYYFMTGTGITAGYHRLWAHRAFQASWPVQFYLLCCSSGALEGSVKWWCGGHRIHHRYTDTEKDPYNSNGGFLYAHFGWMLVYPKPENFRKADIRDLNASTMIRLQHKYYLAFAPFMAIIFPALVSHWLLNDFYGGLVYAGFIRLFFVHHSTFCVNSVAHYLGDHVYDDERTPRDSFITALVTFGEGYHNFHHEFPNDYRNAIKWYQYDPTKWLINIWYSLGLVSDLKTFPQNEIDMGMLTMQQKKLDEAKRQVKYPLEASSLPEMSLTEFQTLCNSENRSLTIINGIVHDIQPFITQHPGGVSIIKMAIGKDATEMFNGYTDIYKHSRAANNLLGQFRVAKLNNINNTINTKDKDITNKINNNNDHDDVKQLY